jgi:hypothetical protein
VAVVVVVVAVDVDTIGVDVCATDDITELVEQAQHKTNIIIDGMMNICFFMFYAPII